MNILYKKGKWYLKQLLLSPFRLLPIDKEKVVFLNFAGRGYGDNPKYIAEAFLKKQANYDLVWLVEDMNQPIPSGIRKIKYKSIQSYYELATAKFWVDNIRNSSRPLKRKHQIYLQTWHGSFGPKLCEQNAESSLDPIYVWLAKYDGKICNGFIMGDELQNKTIGKRLWLTEDTEILKTGLPRNDIFFNREKVAQVKMKLREKYHILPQEKVVLYMPTHRDGLEIESSYIQDFDALREAFEILTGAYVKILVKYHPNIAEKVKINQLDSTIIDVTCYPDSQELFCLADYLISDYSSAPTDFALLNKPVFLASFDMSVYRESRGLLPEYDTLPYPRSSSFSELLETIRNFDQREYVTKYNNFRNTYESYEQGDAANRVVSWLLGHLVDS